MAKHSRILATYFLIFSIAPQTAVPESNAGDTDDEFVIRRYAHLAQECIAQPDTKSPVFHGCVDWHSAVHGHWAVLWAAYRLPDPALAQKERAGLTKPVLDAELTEIKRRDVGETRFEMPYGRAWLLQLARDAETLFGIKTVRPLADYIFSTLLVFARNGDGDIASAEYANASWYLYQMMKWTEFICDKELQKEVADIIRSRLSRSINLPSFSQLNGFFDPNALAVLALLSANARTDEIRALADELVSTSAQPLTYPYASAHQSGLNFSRSWGLLALFNSTDDPLYLDSAKRYLSAMALSQDKWSLNYQRYAHWLPQFGLFSDRLRYEHDIQLKVTQCR